MTPLLRFLVLSCTLAVSAISSAPVHAGQGLDPAVQRDMVDAHNTWRMAVGTAPLVWSDDLADAAQQWADRLAADKGCKMEHSSSGSRQKTGENLYWASPLRWSDGRLELQKVSGSKVANAWGDEKSDYDEAGNRCASGKMCGHYTQVVWHTTKEVGCAMQQCPDKSQVWVCRYRPTGNWVGERPY